ncbi:response regulator transcription factor [Sulfitobacter sabulilitoris]|uniref:Response regulator transcription factor n=2 Tax=Sulfitobacter sabulilitoris TaxID=2562655 RepID=A0A5S3PPU5_9RHOB|nr:response regulator transcription factor [Sulfitobacter sabulilitoris]
MNIQFDRWLSVFRLVLSGDGFLPYELLSASLIAHADNMPAAVSADPSGMSDVDLTAREREVLTLVAEGKQNKIIAEDLNLSVHTVKLHIHHLITKLGVHNRTEAALRYSAMMQQSGDKGP